MLFVGAWSGDHAPTGHIPSSRDWLLWVRLCRLSRSGTAGPTRTDHRDSGGDDAQRSLGGVSKVEGQEASRTPPFLIFPGLHFFKPWGRFPISRPALWGSELTTATPDAVALAGERSDDGRSRMISGIKAETRR